jgi:hypothetical protein
MEIDETEEKEEKNVPFAEFSPYFKDAMEKTDFVGIHPDPFLIISDFPALTTQFEMLFNDIARHYSSLFPPRNKEEKEQCPCLSYPETNFNARLCEALLALLESAEKESCNWNGFDLAKYSKPLLDDIFSLNDQGESLFPCINAIKERAGLRPGKSYVLFQVTFIDHDLDGRRGFSVSLAAQHLSH